MLRFYEHRDSLVMDCKSNHHYPTAYPFSPGGWIAIAKQRDHLTAAATQRIYLRTVRTGVGRPRDLLLLLRILDIGIHWLPRPLR